MSDNYTARFTCKNCRQRNIICLIPKGKYIHDFLMQTRVKCCNCGCVLIYDDRNDYSVI